MQPLDYGKTERKRQSPRQVWVGIALWIFIAAVLTVCIFGIQMIGPRD